MLLEKMPSMVSKVETTNNLVFPELILDFQYTVPDQKSRKGWSKKVYNALMQLSIVHAEKFNLEANTDWNAQSDKW